MNSNFDYIADRVVTIEELQKRLRVLRFLGKKIVFTNGCFDILHLGHVNYLAQAADFGSLIVGVNSDASVRKQNKGSNRPLQDQKARAIAIAALRFVELVVIFEEETPYNLIKIVQPEFLIKGSDYSIEQIVGHDIVLAKGGEVKTIDLVEGYSTTAIENKIRKA